MNCGWRAGRDLIVAPVVEKGARRRNVYLTQGTWRDAFDTVGARSRASYFTSPFACPHPEKCPMLLSYLVSAHIPIPRAICWWAACRVTRMLCGGVRECRLSYQGRRFTIWSGVLCCSGERAAVRGALLDHRPGRALGQAALLRARHCPCSAGQRCRPVARRGVVRYRGGWPRPPCATEGQG